MLKPAAEDPQQGEQRIEPLVEVEDVLDEEQGVRMGKRAIHHHPAKRRRGDRGQGRYRVAAKDQLERIERARHRGIEGCGNGSRRPCSNEDALVGTAQLEVLAHFRQDARAQLAVARLHADGDTRHVGDERVDNQPRAVARRHAAAMEGIGFDGIDDLAGTEVAHDDRRETEQQAADHRHIENALHGRRRGRC